MGKNKVVNVVLSSTNALSGNTQKANYFVNWGAILDDNKEYYLHFTYLGGTNTYLGTKLANLYVDFQTSNVTNNSSNGVGAYPTTLLGFLKPIVLVGASNYCYLQAEDNTNVPTYLQGRPTNNNFSVSIFDNASNPTLFLDNATTPAIPAPYMLVLSFREVSEDD